MYAIVRTGGKQERVEEGRSITVERLPAEEGSTVELLDVLLIADNGKVTVGTPVIEGARVVTEVEEHGRAKKIIVFKYRAKVRSRKKTGHRQSYTKLSVIEILRPGQESKTAKKTPARRRKAKEETPDVDATVETAKAPEAKAAAPKRRTRTKATAEKPAAAPKRRTTAKKASTAEASAEAKPKRRTRAKAADAPAKGEASVAEEKPKRTARKRTTKTAGADDAATETKKSTPRRRTARPKKTDETE